MPFRMDDFIWADEIVDKIIDKHGVYPDEVEQCFFAVRYKLVGTKEGKYLLYSQSREGRYLLVVFVWVWRNIKIISARDMTIKERRIYKRK